MPSWLQDLYRDTEEYRKLRRALQRDLADEIESAEKAGWPETAISQAKVDIRRLLTLSGRLSSVLLLVGIVPFVFVIIHVATDDAARPYSIGYGIFSFWAMTVMLGAMALLWPLAGILRTLKGLPDPIYRQLMQSVWQNIELLDIALNFCLTLFVILSLRTGHPLVVLLGVLWLTTPLLLFWLKQDVLFVRVRLGQLALLFFAAALLSLNPIPMKQIQWRARKDVSERLRVVDPVEITAQWATLKWFTPEGMPAVWYSERDGSYHLYSTPGYDPITNDELTPVADAIMREAITTRLRQESADAALNAARQQERLANETRIQRDIAERKEAERIANENARQRIELIEKYVFPDFRGGKAKTATVLVVFDENGNEDAQLNRRVGDAVRAQGQIFAARVFTPAFFETDIFRNLGKGMKSGDFFSSADYASRLFIVRVRSQVSPSSSIEGQDLFSAEVSLAIRVITLDNAGVESEDVVVAKGVGFKAASARNSAIDRAIISLGKNSERSTERK